MDCQIQMQILGHFLANFLHHCLSDAVNNNNNNGELLKLCHSPVRVVGWAGFAVLADDNDDYGDIFGQALSSIKAMIML